MESCPIADQIGAIFVVANVIGRFPSSDEFFG